MRRQHVFLAALVLFGIAALMSFFDQDPQDAAGVAYAGLLCLAAGGWWRG